MIKHKDFIIGCLSESKSDAERDFRASLRETGYAITSMKVDDCSAENAMRYFSPQGIPVIVENGSAYANLEQGKSKLFFVCVEYDEDITIH